MRDHATVHAEFQRTLTGSFAPGTQLKVTPDLEGRSYRIEDASGRPVAVIPRTAGGEAITRGQCWWTGIESRGRGWAVLFRTARDGPEVALAAPSLLPFRYVLRVLPDSNFRLSKSPLSGAWTLRSGRQTIARFALDTSGRVVTTDAGDGIVLHRIDSLSVLQYGWRVALLEGTLSSSAELPLLILLALDTIRADDMIPAGGQFGAGG